MSHSVLTNLGTPPKLFIMANIIKLPIWNLSGWLTRSIQTISERFWSFLSNLKIFDYDDVIGRLWQILITEPFPVDLQLQIKPKTPSSSCHICSQFSDSSIASIGTSKIYIFLYTELILLLIRLETRALRAKNFISAFQIISNLKLSFLHVP